MKAFSALLGILLFGCSSPASDPASQDARLAIGEQDYRLYELPVRGQVLPGIEVNERAAAAELCGTRILAGAGDVLRNQEQLAERKAKTDYAAKYNQAVYQACQKALRP